MKNRKLLYVLIPLTILVWGLAAIRILHQLRKPTDSALNVTSKASNLSKKQESDIFRLTANYADPFLGHEILLHPTKNLAFKEIKKFSRENTNNIPVQWPEIKYAGMILNKNNNKQVYLLQVNAKSYLLRQGESADKVELRTAYKDSIIVSFNHSSMTVRKIKI